MKHKIIPEYKRNLPHYQPDDDPYYFVTARLNETMPLDVVLRLKEEQNQAIAKIKAQTLPVSEILTLIDQQQRRYFGKFDRLLDACVTGHHWLKTPQIAEIVFDSLIHRNGISINLVCFTIMSNHVHIVFSIIPKNCALYGIMHSFKRYTAQKSNEVLNRKGQFWLHESYDRVIRDEAELNRIVDYVLNNPVNIGLVNEWTDWKYSYFNENYL